MVWDLYRKLKNIRPIASQSSPRICDIRAKFEFVLGQSVPVDKQYHFAVVS